ncbi:hypothetical protein PCYB_135140 [Plasmodium cynomolgi strain B]|uniref:Uncharacterized protein n=1 Tax=Plasmodium cynomolgi (strain B) TaxID=1120755 RepID=K6V0R9_PLACD|nr:hypothetical protein PCYB_135140 [Plasmodium cynomolgi strain B]GAB68640.1 hypothetical protein PCYB_135140 [Plasmodium cynomolgi strain B]
MVESNDDPDSCSVYDDTVEKNINFSESILANLNDNIFEQNDAFTNANEKLSENFFMLEEEIANGKQLDVHPGEGRTSSASSSSSVHVRDGRVSLLFEDESAGGGGPSGQRTEAMSRGGWKTPYKERSESTNWGTFTKHEVAEEEGVITAQGEQSRRNNTTTEGNEKERFVFPIKMNKKSWSKEKASEKAAEKAAGKAAEKAAEKAYDEYNHNVIYHELYVELLQVNKSLQNEIKNLKKIIEMQKLLIKSREDLFGSSHMNEKNKISKMEEDEKGGGYWAKGGKGPSRRENYYQAHKNGDKNRRPKWERMDNNDEDDVSYSEVEMNTIDNNEDTHDHKNEYVKLPLSENEGSVPSDNASGGGSCGGGSFGGNHSDSQRGSQRGSHRDSQRDAHHDNNRHTPARASNQGSYFSKRGNYEGLRGKSHSGGQKSYERGYQGGKKMDREKEQNEIPVNFQEITAVTLWYEEILPLINNEKKKL